MSLVTAADMAAGASPLPGVTIVGMPFYASVEDVLRRQSNCFDVVYLHGAEIALRYGHLARHHAPRARVLSSVAELRTPRLASAQPGTDADASCLRRA